MNVKYQVENNHAYLVWFDLFAKISELEEVLSFKLKFGRWLQRWALLSQLKMALATLQRALISTFVQKIKFTFFHQPR